MSIHRLLNHILCDEERADRIEANLNVHLQSYAKNVGRIQDDFSRVVEKINICDDRVDVHQQRHVDQELFNCAILERMQELEGTIEGQTERIVLLEEEVASLCWKKECKCSKTIIATGSGEGEESELEYVEEVASSGLSYHSPTVAQEEVPLLVFGEVLPGDTQSLPVEVQETCGCPVPTIIRIEDDVEMVATPRENNTPIPVQVDELPSFSVRTPCASRGKSKAYFHIAPIVTLCNLGLVLIHLTPGTTWVKISDFHAQENSVPLYSEPSEESIRDALETLRNQLSIRQMFLEMPMEDL